MIQYKATKEMLGIKVGDIFVPINDESYKSGDVTLNISLIKKNPEYFKEEEFNLWKPTQNGEIFYIVSTDFGVAELSWDESRFTNAWLAGNVFRDREFAKEASEAIKVLIQTYQKKFSDYIKKYPKEPKVVQVPVQQVQQPQQLPQQPPPLPQNIPNLNHPRFSPFARAFSTPGNER